MDKEFIELAQKIIVEKGRDFLDDPKLTKALFLDYGRNEYKPEINLLTKTIELGYSKKIKASDDLNIIKLVLSRQLCKEHFINEKMSISIILLLIGILKDKNYLTEINKNDTFKTDDDKIMADEINTKEETKKEKSIIKNNKIKRLVKKDIDIEIEKLKIWVCGRCGNKNDIYLAQCEKCGKKFNL
jgi:ribosomal protein L40E